MTTTDTPAVAPRRRRRGMVSLALIVVASIVLPLAAVTVWVRNQVLDTDKYVETIEPLSSDPDVLASVSARVSRQIIDAIDLPTRVTDLLEEVGPRATALAPVIAAGAQNVVQNLVDEVLASDQFQKIWVEVNRLAHDQMVAALTGREGRVISRDDGKVVLQLAPLAAAVVARVEDRFGFQVPDSVVERFDLEYELLDSPDLASAQSAVRLLDRLAWLTVLIWLAALAVALWVADDKRVAIRRIGLGIVVSMGVMLVAYGFARTRYLDAVPSREAAQAAGEAVFDTLTRFVQRAFRMALVAGLVLVAGAWLAGPSSAALRVRTTAGRVTGRAGEMVDPGPVPRWVDAHMGGLHAAVGGLALVALVVWEHPTGLSVLLLALLSALAWGLVNAIAAAGRGDPARG